MNEYIVKLYLFMLMVCTCSVMVACDDTVEHQDEDHIQITSKRQVSFTSCDMNMDLIPNNDVDLYFLNEGNVPYINVETYIGLLDSVLQIDTSDIRYEEGQVIIEYHPRLYQYMFYSELKEPEIDATKTYQMILDFRDHSVYVNSYLFFIFQGLTFVDPTTAGIEITNAIIEDGDGITIPFGEYGFEFSVEVAEGEELYLIPFHIASLLFTNSTLYRTYYNGDHIIGGGRCIYDSSIRESSFAGQEIPEDLRRASFQLFLVALDYFSATKEARDIESYQSLLGDEWETVKTAASDQYYDTMLTILLAVDDIHAELPSRGYYALDPSEGFTAPTSFEPHRQAYYDLWSTYFSQFQSIFNNAQPDVRLLDDDTIAVLHLYQFTPGTQSDIKRYLDSLPTTVEDVVLDVSMNGGGSVNAIFRTLAFMTDDEITFKHGIANDGSSFQYTVDVTQEQYDYNWYIKTSALTYSAGHILAMIAQENNIATVIGEPTMGGASVIESVLLPCGFSHTISGNYTFYSKDGTAEFGVDVDIPLNDIWDDTELVSLLNSLQ